MHHFVVSRQVYEDYDRGLDGHPASRERERLEGSSWRQGHANAWMMNLAIVLFIEEVRDAKGYTTGAQAARVLVQSLSPLERSNGRQQQLKRHSLYDWIKRDSGGRAWLEALVSGAVPSPDALSLKSRRSLGRALASTPAAGVAAVELPSSPGLTAANGGGREGGEGSPLGSSLFFGLSPAANGEVQGGGSPVMQGNGGPFLASPLSTTFASMAAARLHHATTAGGGGVGGVSSLLQTGRVSSSPTGVPTAIAGSGGLGPLGAVGALSPAAAQMLQALLFGIQQQQRMPLVAGQPPQPQPPQPQPPPQVQQAPGGGNSGKRATGTKREGPKRPGSAYVRFCVSKQAIGVSFAAAAGMWGLASKEEKAPFAEAYADLLVYNSTKGASKKCKI